MYSAPYDYYYDYGYSYSGVDSAMEGVGGFMLVFILLFYFLMFAYSVLTYVLHSMGMYTVAKRRGIQNPWLSWIPLGDLWILGSISDQYQRVAKGKECNRRKLLLGLSVSSYTILLLIFAGAISMAIGGASSSAAVGASAALLLIAYFAILIMAVILAVFQYIAYYDYFCSCDPGNAVLYLVLSIFVSVVLPFFVFGSRNKDLGMQPPKPPQPQMIPQPAPYAPPQQNYQVPPQQNYQVPPQQNYQVPPQQNYQTPPPVQNQNNWPNQ